MSKKVLTVEQILSEIVKRMQKDQPPDELAEAVVLSMPIIHPLDVKGRNWDIAETRKDTAHNSHVRRVVEEARFEFYLSRPLATS
ncbi:hypothetical protein [Cupriavidus pampae]|uniref:Uncharacterized protein n=1 Tax=Cupriavidus pampae TaxID=659251 RepID=A0ABN7ZKR0_9BURK|nr:hypothetical protein [Cupriavidus pampae]CAG9186409.1 hypothetical protein LMG32289_06410 [Cupriavidus pampae]